MEGLRPIEDQEHLFDRFYRSSNAAEGSIPGTGLGLSIVKAIVEAHGGTVTVSSVLVRPAPEELAETCFVVRIPKRVPRGNEP